MRAVGDQSVFVKAAIFGVLREAVLAAGLVGLMILLFLGSWRSTLIIIISIPLSILFSVAAIAMLGETINVMTLGGLALAVGMLVDEGTVTLENIFFHLEQGKPVEPAILDGAQQIVVPAFVTLLVLDIVFAPMFQLGGVAGYLFRPLAEAVVCALIGSFYPFADAGADDGALPPAELTPVTMQTTPLRGRRASRNPFKRFQAGFERVFTWTRGRYRSMLALALSRPKTVIVGFVVFVVLSLGLEPFLGENFFPPVDSGEIPHARARPAGYAHRRDGTTIRLHRADRSQHHPARPAR